MFFLRKCGLRGKLISLKGIISVRKMTSCRYVWIDLEMTGLNPETDTILEVACIVTTPDLEIIGNGVNLVVHQPDHVLNSMLDWCKNQHGKSQLIDNCKASTITMQEAEKRVCNYIKECSQINGANYIAGNSVYMDLIFLNKYMPAVTSLLHYRLIDVTSVRILCENWYGKTYRKNLSGAHRALNDIKNSIEQLRYYKENFFK